MGLVRAQPTMTASSWLLLLILSALWGGSFFFFKILVAALPPLTIVLLRVVIGGCALLAFLYGSGQALPAGRKAWRDFFVLVLLNNVIPFSLIIWSEIRIASGLAAILNATSPVFSVLLAQFVTKQERLTLHRAVGVAVGLFGAALLVGPSALHGLNLTSLAQLAVVLAAFSYACGAAYVRQSQPPGSPLVISAGQLIAAAIVMLPLSLALDKPWTFTHAPGLTIWGALLGLALLSTALAYVIYFRILATAGATNALLVTLLSPVSALVLGSLFLKEPLSALNLIGMAVIFIGLAILDGRIFRLRTAPTRIRTPGTNTGHST